MMRGIDCVRINCAHDTPEAWAAMMTHLRRAEVETGRTCTVLMDLAGPKVRTAEVIAPKTRPRLLLGDSLLLTRDRPRLSKRFLFQASCTHPAILDHLQVGAAVWIDDGRIGCRVEELGPQGAMLCVTAVRPKGRKLQADQGLNFPDTALPLPPLTDKDLSDLDFMVAHAHAVGFSFVQQPADIDLLLQEIRARVQDRGRSPALVAKIETMHAIRNLPELIVHAAGQVPFGVMIARGDLAVEIGYQHLAEMQEELLCLCKAAYIPVIWATQVLENLTKQGIPSRAEMTDAAMAERAECVMLNKGPYLAETVTMLDDVLTRMQAYRSRKTAPGRALYAW
jgi:pyruvate kinase